jgi:pimeloyl-ACP methyl ester carboxylesterase
VEHANRRDELYGLLGRLPPRTREISAVKISEEEKESYVLEKLILDLNGIEPVPAYFLKPKKAEGNVPAILYHHSHGLKYHVGKEEILTGSPSLYSPYGEELAKRGIASICIDFWAFGERSGRTESSLFKSMLWHGQVMWGMMVYDSLRAMDYLAARPEVDPDRIGTIGLSMGSTMAWWIAALDPRIKAVVDICCLTDFQTLIEEDGLDRQGLFYYVPDLLNHFTTTDINALIAPRPHLSLAGIQDELTPLKGLNKINEELSSIYRDVQAEDAWNMLLYDVGHQETKEMREAILKFLDERL